MPIAAPVLAALITAGVSGTEIGLQASGALNPGGGGPSPADLERQQQEAAQKAQQKQEQEMFKHFAPDVQAQTGGSLADPSFAAMVASLAGSPADIGLSQQTIFGSGTPGLASGTGG